MEYKVYNNGEYVEKFDNLSSAEKLCENIVERKENKDLIIAYPNGKIVEAY